VTRRPGLSPTRIARIRAAWRILRHGCLYGQPWWDFETCPRCTGINYCVCKPRDKQTAIDALINEAHSHTDDEIAAWVQLQHEISQRRRRQDSP
jgi:hypothetical protein